MCSLTLECVLLKMCSLTGKKKKQSKKKKGGATEDLAQAAALDASLARSLWVLVGLFLTLCRSLLTLCRSLLVVVGLF